MNDNEGATYSRCGFTPTGGDTREVDGVTYCHGPGIPEPTCWQLATSDGTVVQGNFGREH